MSRDAYLDNSKKPLIFRKGGLQKEPEDFGLNSSVLSTHVTPKQHKGKPSQGRPQADRQAEGCTRTDPSSRAGARRERPSRNGFLAQQPESEPQNPSPLAERRPCIVFPWEPHWGCSLLPPAQNVQFPSGALSDLLPLRTPRAGAGLPSLTGLPPISGAQLYVHFMDGAQHDGTGQQSPSGGPGGGHAARAAPSARSQPWPPPRTHRHHGPSPARCWKCVPETKRKNSIYMYTYIYMFIHTHTHIYMYMSIYIYTYRFERQAAKVENIGLTRS